MVKSLFQFRAPFSCTPYRITAIKPPVSILQTKFASHTHTHTHTHLSSAHTRFFPHGSARASCRLPVDILYAQSNFLPAQRAFHSALLHLAKHTDRIYIPTRPYTFSLSLSLAGEKAQPRSEIRPRALQP